MVKKIHPQNGILEEILLRTCLDPYKNEGFEAQQKSTKCKTPGSLELLQVDSVGKLLHFSPSRKKDILSLLKSSGIFVGTFSIGTFLVVFDGRFQCDMYVVGHVV